MAEEDYSGPRRSGARAAAGAMAFSADAGSDEGRAFLRKQVELADLEIEDLKREDAIRHWSLRVHHISDVLKLTFELALALIFGAIVLVIATTAWSAAHEDGLVIEAFSVPPDMTAQGLTGQAIAAKLQDKLAAMQAATDSARPASSYSNNWGNDIKVQIPDTGVSIGEFYRMLTMWLGHQAHITGEVYRTKQGLSISVRASGDAGETVSGDEANLDALIDKAAQSIYAHTQPYRYAVFLQDVGETAESRGAYDKLIAGQPSTLERAWAYNGRGVLKAFTGDVRGALADDRMAASLIGGFGIPWTNIDFTDGILDHEEDQFAAARNAVAALPDDPNIAERARAISLLSEKSDVDFDLGAFADSIRDNQQATQLPDYSGIEESARDTIVLDLAAMHDPVASDAAENALPPTNSPDTVLARRNFAFLRETLLGDDWRRVLSDGADLQKAYDDALKAHAESSSAYAVLPPTQLWPFMAYAHAELGEQSAAGALIVKTPLDCDSCLRIRARLAALRGDRYGMNTWFARATASAPSIPLGWSEWGETLLREGDFDGAIAKLTVANQKGPHYADPLEFWGEALMAKNRADLALAKFEEANKYAPHWGRLHLKWGEALLWTGDKDGAEKQFAVASTLSLTPAEQSALSKMRSPHG